MGVDPASGAGRLMAGSIESPEFSNSLALRLPAWRLGVLWDVLGPPSGALPRNPAGTTVLLFLVDSAVLSSLSSAGVTCKVEIALIKAKSSCFSMAAAGALLPLSVKRVAAHSTYKMKMSSTLSLRTITNPTYDRSVNHPLFECQPASQSANWGRRLARSASRRPPVCLLFLRVTALLGTVTDFLTLTGNMLTLTILESG
jgi:hypothetical protein